MKLRIGYALQRLFALAAILCLLPHSSSYAQQDSKPYTIVGAPEKVPSTAAPRRYAIRIRVPYGKSRSDLITLLTGVAEQQQRALNANALSVYAYREGEAVSGPFSVGQATVAPFGDWARAGETGPLKTKVELQDSYFAGDPAKAVGKAKILVSESGFKTISISRRFESARDSDIIAEVRVGSPVVILETRTSGPYVTRYRIRVKKGQSVIEGWVDENNVK